MRVKWLSSHFIVFLRSLPKTKEFWMFVAAGVFGVLIGNWLFLPRPGLSAGFAILVSILLLLVALGIYVAVCYNVYEGQPADRFLKKRQESARVVIIRELLGLIPLGAGVILGTYYLLTDRSGYAGAAFLISVMFWILVRYFLSRQLKRGEQR